MTKKMIAFVIALAIIASFCILPVNALSGEDITMDDPSNWCGTCAATPEPTLRPTPTEEPTPYPCDFPVIEDFVCGDFEYSIYSYYMGAVKYCYISGYNGTSEFVQIPSSVDGIEVDFIQGNAFEGNLTMKYVIVPGVIASVPVRAFKDCANLEKIYIPYNTKVYSSSFEGCENVEIVNYYDTDDIEFYYYIEANTSVSDLSNGLSAMYNYELSSENADLDSLTFVGTGVELKVVNKTASNAVTLKTVVSGDVSGDGKITSVDYMKIKRMFTEKSIADDYQFKAADYNRDGNLATNDYLGVKRAFKYD